MQVNRRAFLVALTAAPAAAVLPVRPLERYHAKLGPVVRYGLPPCGWVEINGRSFTERNELLKPFVEDDGLVKVFDQHVRPHRVPVAVARAWCFVDSPYAELDTVLERYRRGQPL